MYDVDMTRIEAKLEAAFMNESSTNLTLAETVRLRRYISSLKNDLRELNVQHLKVVNESVPIDYIKSLVENSRDTARELKELKEKLMSLEFSGKGAKCPICYRGLKHAEDCWLGNSVTHVQYQRPHREYCKESISC